MTQSHELAIAHVAGLADGGPGDPAWRVTLHFHPDRLAGGMPILRQMADDGMIGDASRTGCYDEQAPKRVWHYVARFGSREMRNARAGEPSPARALRLELEDHHAVAGAADQAHVVLDKQHGLPLVGQAAEGDAEFL
jgi:DNA-binding PucR family transcriptional regulator